jgi:hypothetical protein
LSFDSRWDGTPLRRRDPSSANCWRISAVCFGSDAGRQGITRDAARVIAARDHARPIGIGDVSREWR